MAVIKGDYGAVYSLTFNVFIPQIRSFFLDITHEGETYVASNTKCGTGVIGDKVKGRGSFFCFGSAPLVNQMPGDELLVQFYLGPDDGKPFDGTNLGTGTTIQTLILIDSLQINWNFETGEPISYVTTFIVIDDPGIVEDQDEFEAGVPLQDVSPVDIVSTCDTKVEIADRNATEFFEYTDLTRASLTITNDVHTFVFSKASIGSSPNTSCGQDGIPGATNFKLQLDRQNTQIERPNPGYLMFSAPSHIIKLYTGPVEHWLLKRCRFIGPSNIRGNVETGEIVGFTDNFIMQAWEPLSTLPPPDDEIGEILKPGELTGAGWWP